MGAELAVGRGMELRRRRKTINTEKRVDRKSEGSYASLEKLKEGQSSSECQADDTEMRLTEQE